MDGSALLQLGPFITSTLRPFPFFMTYRTARWKGRSSGAVDRKARVIQFRGTMDFSAARGGSFA